MILCCSAGCHMDMDSLIGSGNGYKYLHSEWLNKRPGDKCPSVKDYDRGRTPMTRYCGRRLFDLDGRVEELYSRCFSHRLSGDDPRLENMTIIDVRGSTNAMEAIRALILSGKKVVTGYFCTAIRNLHNPVILYDR